jgi:hypothetical protein
VCRDGGTLILWVLVSLLTGLLMGTVFYQQVRKGGHNLALDEFCIYKLYHNAGETGIVRAEKLGVTS